MARAEGKRVRAALQHALTFVNAKGVLWARKIDLDFGRRVKAGGGGGRDPVSAAISEHRGRGSRRRFGASMP